MLTIIAEIQTHAGAEHRQAVLDAFQEIIPTVLAEDGCHGYEPLVDHLPAIAMQAQDENRQTGCRRDGSPQPGCRHL